MQHSKQPHDAPLGCDECQPWALSLSALSLQRVVRLEMPSVFMNAAIAGACKALPSLVELVLHINEGSETGETVLSSDSESSDDEAAFERAAAWQWASQLRSLTLSVPPGQPPYSHCPMEPSLDLSQLPTFQHLRLVGPLVRSSSHAFFMVPPCAKVCLPL